jgi:transcriptional regulator with XRE-family HTH domain
MEFGPRLKQFRMRERKTQQELGDAIGSDVPYVSRLEKAGGPRPKRETVAAAAAFLGLSDDEREELLLLAEHLPRAVQELATRPAARQLLRSISRLSDAEQEQILEEVLRQIEAQGPDDTGPGSGAPRGHA